jgi:hypothetical protein
MSDKLEVFENLQTGWNGLWYHPEVGGFSSGTINLSKLKKFKGTVKFYVRKNKLYKKDTNRPNYVFCIKDSNSPTFSELTIEEDEDAIEKSCYYDEDKRCYYDEDGKRLYTREEVQYAINESAFDARNGCTDNLVEDYLDAR